MEGKLRIFSTLMESVSLWAKNLIPNTAIMIVASLPLVAVFFAAVFFVATLGVDEIAQLEAFLNDPSVNPVPSSAILLFVACTLFTWFVMYAGYGAVIYRGVESLSGRKAGILKCISRGYVTALPLIVVGILWVVMYFLGIILFVIPGIMVLVIFYAWMPVTVVERPGIIAAFKRSAELSKGNRWRVLGVNICFLILYAAFIFIVYFASLVGVRLTVSAPDYELMSLAESVMSIILLMIVPSYTCMLMAAVYYRLRLAKDGDMQASSEAGRPVAIQN